MKFTAIVAAVLLTGYLYASEDARILQAIGAAETGNDPTKVNKREQAMGQYQMRWQAWRDANLQLTREGEQTYPISEWHRPMVQDIIALAYLRVIRDRLRVAGYPKPTVAQIALCWNMGFSAAHRIDFNPYRAFSDYSIRVQNIYASQN